MFLECDPSAVSDPDKNFWISYRIGIMNQKDHNRSLWKESSLCTKTWSSSILQFMKLADLLEAGAGYLVHETVIFVCEILDYCPWFEFSDLEVCILYIYLPILKFPSTLFGSLEPSSIWISFCCVK